MITVKGLLKGIKIFLDTTPPKTIILKRGYLAEQEVVANIQKVGKDEYEVIKMVGLTQPILLTQDYLDAQRRGEV